MKTSGMWRLTEEQKQEATSRYEAGESCGAIAKDYGVSRQSMWDVLRRRTEMRDRIEALPRKEQTAIRTKRAAALKRYRSRADRITRAQIREVWARDQVCQMCGEEGEEIDHILPVSMGGQTEMANLQLLCKPCHTEKSRAERKGVSEMEASDPRLMTHSGGETYKESEEVGSLTQSASETSAMTPLVSTSSAEASRDCAKTSPSPADEQDSQGQGPGCSSSSHESLTLWSDPEGGCSLRTFPDFFPPTTDAISPSFSRRWPSSGFTTSPGECWTADTSECPSGGDGSSSLRDVLVGDVPARFFLSPRAAAGILRRAEKRGRELPAALRQALRELSKPMQAIDGRAPTTTPTSLTRSAQRASTPQRTAPGGEPRSSVRRLTPTECERLQGLPDGFTIPYGPPLR